MRGAVVPDEPAEEVRPYVEGLAVPLKDTDEAIRPPVVHTVPRQYVRVAACSVQFSSVQRERERERKREKEREREREREKGKTEVRLENK